MTNPRSHPLKGADSTDDAENDADRSLFEAIGFLLRTMNLYSKISLMCK
jgi:hypothetical protein